MWKTPKAVSYTHLDVYKRQGRGMAKALADKTLGRAGPKVVRTDNALKVQEDLETIDLLQLACLEQLHKERSLEKVVF